MTSCNILCDIATFNIKFIYDFTSPQWFFDRPALPWRCHGQVIFSVLLSFFSSFILFSFVIKFSTRTSVRRYDGKLYRRNTYYIHQNTRYVYVYKHMGTTHGDYSREQCPNRNFWLNKLFVFCSFLEVQH